MEGLSVKNESDIESENEEEEHKSSGSDMQRNMPNPNA
jgi:hypothetical protein